MKNRNYDEFANKLAYIDDKISEIEIIMKMLDIWVKEKDYELIPIINVLNTKIDNIVKKLRV